MNKARFASTILICAQLASLSGWPVRASDDLSEKAPNAADLTQQKPFDSDNNASDSAETSPVSPRNAKIEQRRAPSSRQQLADAVMPPSPVAPGAEPQFSVPVETPAMMEDDFDIFDRPTNKSLLHNADDPLSLQAQRLATSLGVTPYLERLKVLHDSYQKDKSSVNRMEALILQCRLSRALQHASLQLQETFANIDGDLAQTNMLLAFASTRRDKALLMSNVATFVGSGTFGILDSATTLGGLASPTSEVLGILGFSTSVVLPLLALRNPRYDNPRHNQPRLNMLTPIFEKQSKGEGYQPIVWRYIESVPPGAVHKQTRRDLLIDSWKSYRGFNKGGNLDQVEISAIVNAPYRERKLSIETLRVRAELLIDIRAMIQSMYRDLSELDAHISNFI